LNPRFGAKKTESFSWKRSLIHGECATQNRRDPSDGSLGILLCDPLRKRAQTRFGWSKVCGSTFQAFYPFGSLGSWGLGDHAWSSSCFAGTEIQSLSPLGLVALREARDSERILWGLEMAKRHFWSLIEELGNGGKYVVLSPK